MSALTAEHQSRHAWATLVLFLDFDGVLQTPALEGWEEMELCDELEALLGRLPGMAVVVTSSHREGRTLQEVASLLPPVIQSRVIGVTPVTPIGRSRGGRQLEIEAWLAQSPRVTTWAAVDDEPQLYRSDCPWLVATHKLLGWTDETTLAVQMLLGGAGGQPRMTGTR